MSRDHFLRVTLPDVASDEEPRTLDTLSTWLGDNGTLRHEVRDGDLVVEIEDFALSGGYSVEAAAQSLAIALGTPRSLVVDAWEFSDGWFAEKWRAGAPTVAHPRPFIEVDERADHVPDTTIWMNLRAKGFASEHGLAAVVARLADLPRGTWKHEPSIYHYGRGSENEPSGYSAEASVSGQFAPDPGLSLGALALHWCSAVREAAGSDVAVWVDAWDLADPRWHLVFDATNWPIAEPAGDIWFKFDPAFDATYRRLDPKTYCGYCHRVTGDSDHRELLDRDGEERPSADTTLVTVGRRAAVCATCAGLLVQRLPASTGLIETGGNPPIRAIGRSVVCASCRKGPEAACLVVGERGALVLCGDCLRIADRIAAATPPSR